ncbi:DUF3592 domain-containing protein [Streptomyces sp. NPDC048309]|uniref:DUF3592 domain-containing protein n=1 Tax=Streptomyces sp. NPDC048309 TaxID=3154618 RepID=UPI003403393A
MTLVGRGCRPAVRTGTERLDGRDCEYSSRFGRGSVGGEFGVGTFVMVRYDPEDPRRFAIQGWDGAAVDLVFTVVGSVLTAGTSVVLLVRLLTL